MNVKEAVRIAKTYLIDLFSEERIVNVGLEEIEFDDLDRIWNVTLGFTRAWNDSASAILALTGNSTGNRSFRVVKVRDSDGHVLSIKLREKSD